MNIVGHDVAVGIRKAQPALVPPPRAIKAQVSIPAAYGHEHGGEVAEDVRLLVHALHAVTEEFQRARGNGQRFRNTGQNFIACRCCHRRRYTARHNPRRVNALAAEQFDDVLPPLTQTNAAHHLVGVLLGHAQHIALRRVRIPAHQKVWCGKMKEAERVRLRHLRQVNHAAQHLRRLRNTQPHDGVARLGPGQQVAYRTDAADARRERWHLIKRTAYAEFLEAPKLQHVQMSILHRAVFVELNGDFSMPFDARDGFNSNGSHGSS